MTTKRLGILGELKALAMFAEYSIPVYIPYGDNERVDFIAEFNGKLQRIQVKSSNTCEDGKIKIGTRSTSVNTKINKAHAYTAEEVDYFIFYYQGSDELFIVPIDEVPAGNISLRIMPPANNQTKGIRFAKDYLLSDFLEKSGYSKE